MTQVWVQPKNRAESTADLIVESISGDLREMDIGDLCHAQAIVDLGDDQVERQINHFLRRLCNYKHGALGRPE